MLIKEISNKMAIQARDYMFIKDESQWYLSSRKRFRVVIWLAPNRTCVLSGVEYAEFEAHLPFQVWIKLIFLYQKKKFVELLQFVALTDFEKILQQKWVQVGGAPDSFYRLEVVQAVHIDPG